MLPDEHEIWIEPREVRPIYLKLVVQGEQATLQFTLREATQLAEDLLQAVRESQ